MVIFFIFIILIFTLYKIAFLIQQKKVETKQLNFYCIHEIWNMKTQQCLHLGSVVEMIWTLNVSSCDSVLPSSSGSALYLSISEKREALQPFVIFIWFCVLIYLCLHLVTCCCCFFSFFAFLWLFCLYFLNLPLWQKAPHTYTYTSELSWYRL